MMKRIERRKKIRKIGALVVFGIFITMMLTPSVSADADDWSEGGDSWGYAGEMGSNDENDVIFITYGTEVMRITTNNRVGIGTTTNPERKLEVVDNSNPQLRLTHTEGSKFCDFQVNSYHDLIIKPSSNGQIKLQPTTDSTDFFQVLDNDGITAVLNVDTINDRVGIGISNPNAKLHVEKDAQFQPGECLVYAKARSTGSPMDYYYGGYFKAEFGGNGVGVFGSGTAFGVYGKADWPGTTAGYFDGNVGIGTPYPQAKLEVAGSGCSIKLTDSGDSYNERASLTYADGTGSYLRLYDDGNNQKVLLRSYDDSFFMGGDVGIGDSSPGAHLVVGSDANMGLADGTGDVYIQNDLEVDGSIYMGNNIVATQNWVQTQAYGDITDVGSMTSGAVFADTSADGQWLGLGGSGYGRIVFDYQTSSTDYINILDANVGIGEPAPSSKLEVNGGLELTNLYDNYGANFFDGGATASQTITGITSTGSLQVTDILISESGLTATVAGDGLTGGAGSPLAVGTGNGIQVNSNSIEVKLDGSTLMKSASGLKVAVYGITATELNSGVAGNGLTGGGGSPLAVGTGDGIQVNPNSIEVKLDGSTLAKSAIGLKVAASGITTTELNSGVAGNGLIGGGGSPLAVGAGDGVIVNPNSIGVCGLMAADGSPTNVVYVSNEGNVGIGPASPGTYNKLHIEADYASSSTNVLYAEYTGTGSNNAIAVYGKSVPQDYYGFGGYFEGGYLGLRATVNPTGNNNYAGVDARATGGSGTNYGVWSEAWGSGSSYGLYGWGHSPIGTGINYGVYGVAFAGSENYAIYGTALGSTGTRWAGYFDDGNVYIKNNLGIAYTSPKQKLVVDGKVGIGYNELSQNAMLAVNGRVGIGCTDTDGYKLKVAGDVKITGETICYGDLHGNNIWLDGDITADDLIGSAINAMMKLFVIDHPLDPENKTLQHACLEGPEFGVFYRGNGTLVSGSATIYLPNYFNALTMNNTYTVLLTAKGSTPFTLSYDSFNETAFIVYGSVQTGEFDWEVKATRDDVDPLEVEPNKA